MYHPTELEKGSLPIWLAMRPNEAIGSSTGTSRFFSGLGGWKGEGDGGSCGGGGAGKHQRTPMEQ